MPQSYVLTPSTLQLRDNRNQKTDNYVSFASINPLAQALRDCVVTGPGLIPGICAAGLCLQARKFASASSPESFYYTLQEAVFALKAARPYSLPLNRTAATIFRLVTELINLKADPEVCADALKCLHDNICLSISHDEHGLREHLEKTLPSEGAIVAIGGFGALTSVSMGTLVPVIDQRKRRGQSIPEVYCPTCDPLTETVCTVRELTESGCGAELFSDSGLPGYMVRGGVRAVYVSGVRICANGDVQTLAGATGVVATAKQLGIPVYVVSYRHCFDSSYASYGEIPINNPGCCTPSETSALSIRRTVVNCIPRDWVSAYVTCAGVVPVSNTDALKPFYDATDTVLNATFKTLRRSPE